MNEQIAFISDVHGMLDHLKTKLKRTEGLAQVSHYVFLGDYINRGPDSKRTIEYLISFSKTNSCTFLRGNHENYFLDALMNRADFGKLIARDGSPTVKSYINEGSETEDVYSAFLRNVPEGHISFIKQMPRIYENQDIVAAHSPNDLPKEDSRFKISAHRRVSTPIITETFASIDTGSGFKDGFITILLWPSLKLI